jgi:hypothetical protein
MILLVLGGGVGTLTTVLTVLQKKRPVVVFPRTGGAARDIHQACVRGLFPANELDPSHEGHAARLQYVEACTPTLRRIRAAAVDAVTGPSLLSFCVGDAFASVHQRVSAIKSMLLGSILPESISHIDAVAHAVSWGDPDVLRAKLQGSLTSLTAEQWSTALQQALACAMRSRTEQALSCISILLDSGASIAGVSFNALCQPELSDRWGVNLAEAEAKLLHKLQISSLDEVGGLMMAQADDSRRSISERSSREPQARRDRRSSRRPSLASVVSKSRYVFHAAHDAAVGHWQPRMKLSEKHSLGFFLLEEAASVCGYRTNLRSRSLVGGTLAEPNFIDLMLWAVLLGNLELATMLWRRTYTPMRAAVSGILMHFPGPTPLPNETTKVLPSAPQCKAS